MIIYKTGNLLESETQALVNTVNTVGVMGKGIALQFKKAFPNNYKFYAKVCKENKLKVGDILVYQDSSLLTGSKIIINFPTKTDWRKPSEYSYIETGLVKLAQYIEKNKIKSIAIPPLGAGNGGLDWNKVKTIIEKALVNTNCEIHIYEPSNAIKEILDKERTKLTPARAMLLAMLFDLVKHGEFISEFAAEKMSYFLQRFGAKDYFKLDFQPNFYGPYSGKVKHVLYYLNGSYIMGYSSKEAKPFEELYPIVDAEKDIIDFLDKEENSKYKDIVNNTKEFMCGFYSSFALELLSTVDYINYNHKTDSIEDIKLHLSKWSNRKRTMFANDKFISIAINHLNKYSNQLK